MDDYLAFEDTAAGPHFGIPFVPDACLDHEWTPELAVAYLRSNVAHVKGCSTYILKQWCQDRLKYEHRILGKRDMQDTLAKFHFPLLADRPNQQPAAPYRGREYLNSPYILMYDRLVFDPASPDPRTGVYKKSSGPYRTFNLFTGFRFTLSNMPVARRDELVAPFVSHARDVLCGGDPGLFDYLMLWMGHLFQHPASKPGSALLLVSKQGAGKNIFFQALIDAMGVEHSVYVNRRDRIQNHFNAHLQNKLLVVVDEVLFSNSREVNNIMKSLITESSNILEKKGQDAVAVRACERYVLLTNESNPVLVEPSDRRYACMAVSNARVGDTAYFATFHQHHRDPEVLQAIHDLLVSVPDVPPVLPPPPVTDLKKELRGATLDDNVAFLRDMATGADGCEDLAVADGAYVTTFGLAERMRTWAARNGKDPAAVSVKKLGGVLGKVFGQRVKKQRSAVAVGGVEGTDPEEYVHVYVFEHAKVAGA